MAASKEEAEKKGGGGGGNLIVALVLATLIAGGGGAGFVMFALQQDKQNEKPAHVETPVPIDPTFSEKRQVIPLAPIITNLAPPSKALVRIEASILIDKDTKGSNTIAANIADDMVTYLRTVNTLELEGPSGFQFLKEDLTERAKNRAPGKVHGIFFTGFSVE